VKIDGSLPTRVLTGVVLNGKTWRAVGAYALDAEFPYWAKSVWETIDELKCDETGERVYLYRLDLLKKLKQYNQL